MSSNPDFYKRFPTRALILVKLYYVILIINVCTVSGFHIKWESLNFEILILRCVKYAVVTS